MTASSKTVIGIICERSVDLDGQLDERGYLKDEPHVKIIKVPCSGMIQPIMFEMGLKQGAEGVFATGCRMGDCHYREGNKFLNERLLGERMPKLKPAVDKRRIQAYWLSAVEYDKFIGMVRDFDKTLAALIEPQAPAVATA
jgi:F420-non-reducing hydrogenase iron-sulfur subunit